MPKTNKSLVPEHLGLIIDGNRRWAKREGKPSLFGHMKGFQNLEIIGEAALERGVKVLSVYVFSTENWNRSQEEIEYLMDMLVSTVIVKKKIDVLRKRGVRVRFLGTRDKLSDKVLAAMDKAEEATKECTEGTLAFCFNFGGRLEIADAVKDMIDEGVESKDVNEELLSKYMYAPDIPPIDYIIRTSGEKRLSNFMLWRAAYSELYFTDKYWPEFSVEDLDEALEEYASRQRRFGK